MANNVTLQPLAMGPYAPAPVSVYAPSRLRPVRVMSEAEFMERYADHPRVVDVSQDGISAPQPTMIYGHGLDCSYMVVPT